jgi:hypothetical protein
VISSFRVEAQVITPQGGQFSLLESIALRGDQNVPQISVNANGGYVVWEDNAIDGHGFGIGARFLDSTFSPGVFGSFRVNQQTIGDQQRPQVAVFPNGGAGFVWEGGLIGAHKIYVRFLTPNRVFSTTNDVPVDSSATGSQNFPAVGSLPGDNLVVAWNSFDGNMQGIFARLVNTNGQFLTSPFRVNQVTNYNQRNPSIAVSSSGSFVVAWVSERQFNFNSIDIVARIFDSTGQPTSDEFRVSTATASCASPAVAYNQSGGFTVCWCQKMHVNNPLLAAQAVDTNSWDIFGRTFAADSTTSDSTFAVNTHLYGDQFSPKIATLGNNQLVVWTSVGEDGSQEGVYGRLLYNGLPSGDAFLVNTTTVSQQINPVVVSDGSSRLVVAWASFVGTATGFDLFAQRYAAGQPLPIPAAPFVSPLWSDRISVTWPTLAGYAVSYYEVYMNGVIPPAPPTAIVADGNKWIAEGLPEHSTNSFQLAYLFLGGARSQLSPAASAVTWKQDRTGKDGLPDGLPDDWQAMYWGVKASGWPAGSVDSDGDGVSNAREFQAGTNPLDPNSVLRMWFTWSRSIRLFLFNWNTQPGFVYQVQVSTDLIDWTNFGNARFAAGSTDSVTFTSNQVAEYYRVIRVR